MTRNIRLFILAALVLATSLALTGTPSRSALAQDDNVVIVNTSVINVRSGPAPNMTVLGTLPGGVQLTVTGRNATTTWWRVTSPYGVGWVSDFYVAFRGTLTTVPVVSTPAGTLETPMVYIDGNPATVYRNPNSDSFVVGIAPHGASLEIIGRSMDGNWWHVQTSAGPGWVNIAAVSLRGDEDLVSYEADPGPSFDGPTARVNVATTVTTEPGGGRVIGTLPAGAAVPAGGRNADNTYWMVFTDFGIGWIPVANVSLAGASSNIILIEYTTTPGPGYTGAVVMTATIEANRKVAYADYSFSSDPMWAATLGEELGVTARSADGLWLEVTNDVLYTGWMHFSGITLNGSLAALPIRDTSPVYENIVIINTQRLHVRSGPGFEYESLGTFPGGATFDVTGKHPELPYIRVEGTFGQGWVRIMYVIFRGDWKAVPFVTEPVGDLEMPQAVVNFPHNVYLVPNGAPAGTIEGGIYTIVAWSSGYVWAQIETPLGLVWLHSAEFDLRGIVDNAPIIAD